ncbi:variant 2, dihydropyrimidinase [Lathyrus oleraceus]|uniref:dihydropyrimidinase n=3 Tax=Pisum sativum TaxID=3888 RepID=A0A9D4Y364_PEA|nr:variant 2, dihydropyrimidinase [Pisum sativum]
MRSTLLEAPSVPQPNYEWMSVIDSRACWNIGNGQRVKMLGDNWFLGQAEFEVWSHASTLVIRLIEDDANSGNCDSSKDPIVLWLNGGPGCSSFDGFVYEHGPFNFDKPVNGSLPKLHLNPYSWSKVSNIIYLDSPVGVGFSYSKNTSQYETGDEKTATDSHTFLLKFLANPLYLAGESYAGVYVPTLAHKVVQGIEAGIKPKLNFKGFEFVGYLIGNPVADEQFDGNALVPFAHGMGLISDQILENITKACNGTFYAINSSDCNHWLSNLNDVWTNLVTTVIGFGMSATFIVFVCTRIICGRLRGGVESRMMYQIESRYDIEQPEHHVNDPDPEPVLLEAIPTLKFNQEAFSSIEDTQRITWKSLVGDEVRVIDATGKFVMPGGIDPHTHLEFEFMNTVTKDDFFSGQAAALAGGTTMHIDFAIPIDGSLTAGFKAYEKKAKKSCMDYGFHMAITKWDETVAREMELMVKEKGINSFKFFMAYKGALMIGDELLLQGLKKCKSLGALAMVHAENGDAVDEGKKKMIELGITGPEGHALSRPPVLEGEATARAIHLADFVNTPLYVVHVMSIDATEEIAKARTSGTTPLVCHAMLMSMMKQNGNATS